MSANLVANVTISGNLTCFSTLFASTANVATGFAIGGVYTYASYGARVACGVDHTAVIMQTGAVRTFGRNDYGKLGVGDTTNRQTPVQVPGISGARSVACGKYHTAVLQNDGTVRMFGNNDVGQLGINVAGGSRQTPVQAVGLSTGTAVACGSSHTAVLLFDRTVRTFGLNANGQLGVNDTTSRQTPVTVLNISTATAVACGVSHTAVLLADGTVRTFGRNNSGQLGLNDTTTRLTPVQVFGISSSATAIACGLYHTAVLLADGTVRTFGFNGDGQLGIDVTGGGTSSRLTPVQVFGISSSATAIAAGKHTIVLLADGTIRTVGRNDFGQLGINVTGGTRQTPVQVFGISSSAVAIASGWYFSAVLLTDGTLRTFGDNTYGGLGTGDTTSRQTPAQVVQTLAIPAARTTVVSIACGRYHTAVLMADGTVRTFGANSSHQAAGYLGVDDIIQRNTPVQVFAISSSATAVACGRGHTAVLLANGTVRTFGGNSGGQLGINNRNEKLTPVQVFDISSSATMVACGEIHTAVLLADGTVRTFGNGSSGRLGINNTETRETPVPVFGISSSATAVACGFQHTIVLLANGTVRTFGNNTFGQLGDNTTVDKKTPVQVFGISSSATAVSGGDYHSAVLLADGTVRTFGRNQVGQLGDNTTTDRLAPVQVLNISTATAVTCGFSHTAVLLANGTVRTFGTGSYGALGDNTNTQSLTPVPVFGISSSATAVAYGMYHMAVILADGTVRTFGRGDSGQLGSINIVSNSTSRLTPVTVLDIPTAFAFFTSAATSITLAASGGQIFTSSATGPARTTSVSIAGGRYFTAVVLVDGTVRMFGKNNTGQLGVNDTTSRLTPVQVFGISSSATAVASGYYHNAVLLANGTVRTFGENAYGQLGVDDTTSRQTPVQVFGISSSATAVSAGRAHTAVLLADGTVRTFGSNGNGELGINVNDGTTRQTPVQVFGISSSATAVAAQLNHTVVLLANGTVRTFGENLYGQLGINVSGGTRQTPVQVFGISSSATAVACGRRHTAVLLADGTVRTFGGNNNSQLGIDVTGGSRETPVTVLNITSATAIACGNYYTALLLADGTVRAVGRNDSGQLGVNDLTSRQTPVQVFGISSSATAIAGGFVHMAILLADRTVRTFGDNQFGQLGVNDTTNRSTPVPVFGALGVRAGTYVTAQGLSLGLSAPTFQLDLSTDGARKLSTTTWTTGSDSRIKSDIQSANLARCVDIVDSLDLKYFKWDIPGVAGPTDAHSLGWIAQDVKEFFPNSVRQTQDYGFDDFHNLDSDQLIKTMYGALKKMCSDTYQVPDASPPQEEPVSSDPVPEPSPDPTAPP